ncbi:hypothetical protein EFW17_23260 [Halostreptopolyspora alba]|uniref:Transposase n=1 Tax=Halostreptopolyspora alba TaxID=2487137 RepID=A0A3N0DRC1_9ACTN|nr:hypothetical protein EFW17_23260 [Nocardiopsaceae bacterium YIM 96095]
MGSEAGPTLRRPCPVVSNSPMPSGPCSPPQTRDAPKGGQWAGHRRVINVILYRTRTGIPWFDLYLGRV